MTTPKHPKAPDKHMKHPDEGVWCKATDGPAWQHGDPMTGLCPACLNALSSACYAIDSRPTPKAAG